jgi:mannose-1-phosphate guanylyltransferase
MKIVIRAGGVGTRLWPKSREAMPKQFQQLLGSKTMMQETWRRARKLVPASKIYVTTNVKLGNLTKKQLPDLRRENLILEPERRDSGPAIGLETLILASQDPDEMIMGFASDHFIGKEDLFGNIVHQAEKIVEKYPDHIVHIGIRPSYAGTGFGYIQMGQQKEDMHGIQYFAVNSFKEKPDYQTAKKFYKDWHYLWNANIFTWKPRNILGLYERFAPKMYAQLMKLKPYLGTSGFSAQLKKIYPRMEKIAVEYIIIEPNKKMFVIPADIDWSDIGDWKEIGKIQKDRVTQNHVSLDDENVLVQVPKGKLVTTLGLKNLAIIDTGDTLLVCSLEKSPEVKKIVEKLKEQKKFHKYL